VAVEREERTKAKAFIAQVHATTTSLRLDDVAGRFWVEKGQHHVRSENTEHRLELLVQFLGKDILLTDVGDEHVVRLKAWRRGHRKIDGVTLIAPATVNRTIATLRELFTYAKLVLRVRFEHEPNWKEHWLKVPKERVRELSDDEADRLDAAMHDDYRPVFDFARASGMRLNELLLIWNEVNFPTKQIVKLGKGGERVVKHISSELRDILWPLQGHHPESVFTFVDRKGDRRPLTYAGVQTYWRRLCIRAGVVGFRFHDYRHDYATKFLRANRDLKLTQKAMNHKDLRSTLRYAHVLDSDVAEGEERAAKLRKKRGVRLKAV
jgi:integrase